MDIEIVYEDRDILAINKPSGLVVHSDGRTKEKTLVDWFVYKYPESKGVGESLIGKDGKEIDRSGVVHRLDRETSGILLLAKTQTGFDNLKSQFQTRNIEKEYHTFVYGRVKLDKGIINRPIGRSGKDFRKKTAQRGSRGQTREAITEYETILRSNNYSFLYVFPKTGRTHQIRVHFKAINYPLVADKLYAGKQENALGFERLALHAYSITFADLRGEKMSAVAPYPEDFELALEKLQSE